MLSDFPKALKSFMGHLEGTHKSENTLKNYRLDILSFEVFLRKRYATRPQFRLTELSSKDLELFQQTMQVQGFKTNTRRRKILTVRRFVQYLSGRKKVTIEVAKKVAAPRKIERVPQVLETSRLLRSIDDLPQKTVLDRRNRLLLRLLAETGCSLSEIPRLQFEHFLEKGEVEFLGKNARKVPVSRKLLSEVEKLRTLVQSSFVFQGYNRGGVMSTTISVRGIELIVSFLSERLGVKELTPRMLRHSRVVSWHHEGLSIPEIQERLGLRTTYAFRVYRPLFNS